MPQFTSKLQHNTYEKGEFSDEQARTLEETLTLIKTFPWDAERPLTDIQLTGPSITILNESGEYLKIGLYFNGKFSLYYLDNSNHLYEYHAPDMAIACNMVTDYFNNALLLDSFEKHFLNIGTVSHFISKTFEYRFNQTTFLLNYVVICVITFVLIALLIFATSRNSVFGIALLVFAYGLFSLHKSYLSNYFKLKGAYLQLSKGAANFTYGNDDLVNVYLKADIKRIYISNAPSKNEKSAIYDITFNDGHLSDFLVF